MLSKNRLKEVDFLGYPLVDINKKLLLELLEKSICKRRPTVVTPLNTASIVYAENDITLKTSLKNSDIITIDSVPITWVLKMAGHAYFERLCGPDIFQSLINESISKKYKIFFLGADDRVLNKVIRFYQKNHPGLNIVGWRNGYFNTHEESYVVESIIESQADILFVGICSPKKEIFINKYKHTMNVPILFGVGGVLDIVGQKTRRAPKWMQNRGLEWLFRLLQEPQRLTKRYLYTNTKFMLMVVKKFITK